MRLVTSLSALAVFVSLAVPASAQVTLELASGKTIEGRVVSDDGAEVEFEGKDGMTARLKYELLSPRGQLTLRALRTPDRDAKAQLALAEWCVTERLYEQARLHFRKALDADASMTEEITKRVAVARKTASKELLTRAKAEQKAGKDADARKLLTTIVQELPLEPAAEEAARLLAEHTAERKQNVMKPRASAGRAASGEDGGARGGADESGQWSADVLDTLKPAIDLYHKMLDANQTGLTSKSQSTAINSFEKSLDDGKKARKAVDKVRGKAVAGDELSQALVVADDKLAEIMADTRIHLSDAYLLRTSYNQATEVVNAGLAEDPRNERLLAQRSRITSAASNNDGGWIIGVGRGGGRRGR